ncbi:MAG TPA: STAS domain-containing protein [bacterium]|nr:STAS domain-containing protein [bacterium]HQG45622.1 STAS domain-containing protein [bacterium]HQI47666.1 STAS domain-containing protein [bacterium]HQJ63369.1 STAS domain-containing protein [bacterium]
MEGIQLSVEKTGTKNSISIIKVGGYIDTTTSSELEHALSTLLKAGSNNIIIDLGNVDYVSSAGWGIFISEIKGIREKGGDLKLVRMIPEVYEVFELLEFHYILKACDTIEDAIKDFERTLGPVTEGAKISEVEMQETHSPGGERREGHAKSDGVKTDNIEDKIRKIIAQEPEIGTVQLIRTLNTPEYGNVRLGWFAMRKLLKKAGLDSKRGRAQLSAGR